MRNPCAALLAAALALTLTVLPSASVPVQAQVPIITIGSVQGVTGATNCRTMRTPLLNLTVRVQGVIYAKTLARTSSGGSNFGFFLQNTAVTADGNPFTSDGIFVFLRGSPTVPNIVTGGPSYTPTVGDEVVISGVASESFNQTQLGSPRPQDPLPRFVMNVRSGVNLDTEVPAFEADPPNALADADCYWERREGMRGRVPAGSQAINGRNVFASSLDGEDWVIRGDSAVAGRADPFARRVFRDAHPLDDLPGTFDNGNGFRILMGSQGLKAAAGDNTVLIAPARTFDTLVNSPVGGVMFAFGKYSVQVVQQPLFVPGEDPDDNSPPEEPDREEEFSVATYNVENLYDFRDDPFDGCDFATNSGCPGVNPPFDFVPASAAAYERRLEELAEQFDEDLHHPDIVLVQEVEDQDICRVVEHTLSCGSTNNADGKPDALQELALFIARESGPAYDTAYDRNGADDRGIINAYMFRPDRVELVPADAGHPVLGSSPQVQYRGAALAFNTDVQNPKVLNAVLPADVDRTTGTDGNDVFTRPVLVGHFRVWRDHIGLSALTDLYILNNHFSSGPDRRVGQRKEQAAYNAAVVSALQSFDAEARILVGGDLNVFPRPDDPFTPGNPRFPSDQLAALYQAALTNLYDRLVSEVPSSAYSFVFQGQAQTLDMMFVNNMLLAAFVQIRSAKINSDWPAEHDGDDARGVSDHDPQVARFSALTVDALKMLVRFYQATNAVTGPQTGGILLDHLARAQQFAAAGQRQAFRNELRAFINQVEGFSPQFITRVAADALKREADRLRNMQF